MFYMAQCSLQELKAWRCNQDMITLHAPAQVLEAFAVSPAYWLHAVGLQ